MSDETNETIVPQLAEPTSHVAGMERGISQMQRDIAQVYQEMAQMRGDIALVNREMSQVSAVLDEHDRMIAAICRKRMVPRTVGPVVLFVAGALLFVPVLCAVLFSPEAFSTQAPLSSLVVWAAVIVCAALVVLLIIRGFSGPRT